MTDGYDVRFAAEIRDRARAVGNSMTLPRDRGAQSVDPKLRLAAALDDNAHLKRLLVEQRERTEEMTVLLRTALWELARAQGDKVPQTFAANWYRRHRTAL